MKIHKSLGLSFASLALFVMGFNIPADAVTFDEILAPLRNAEGKCRAIEGVHTWSMQARDLYEMDLLKTLHLEALDKTYESYECGNHKATVYLYRYSDVPKARDALRGIRTVIWGEQHKSYHHPEDIFVAENVVVVVSGEKPGPVTDVLLGTGQIVSAKGEVRAEKEFEKAKKAFLKKDYPTAEKHYRAVIQIVPDHLISRFSLGNTLYYQERYSEAVPEYEKAMDLNARAKILNQFEERILIDNLGMAYALSGHLDKAKTFYEEAIKNDPAYPDYYYNLACTLAEQGDLDAALTNLKLGFERRSNSLPGESYPNPRTDDSFKKFLGNEKFEAALKEMGF